jgi:hypothetical protein
VNDVVSVLVLALAWFAATNVAASMVAWVLERVAAQTRLMERPGRAARFYFALKLLPGASSVLFTLGLFLPAHWRLEPSGAEETAGYSLVLFAAAGAAIIGVTVHRALRETRATALVVRLWHASATPTGDALSASLGIPVLGLPGPLPIISLVGVLRPALFVGRKVLAAITKEELEVSLAHEAAHHRARDNFKRHLVAWCPDALRVSGLGSRLTASWQAAIEFTADADAVAGSDRRAVALASALVKVARLTSFQRPFAMAAGSRLHDPALLAARVERLLRPAQNLEASRQWPSRWTLAGTTLALPAMVLSTEPAWLAVHRATEAMVRLLP